MGETVEVHSIGGEDVRVRVRRSRRARKVRIDVGLKGVTVVVPHRSDVDPARVLARHADWVQKQRARVADYRQTVPDRTFAAGAMWPYLGETRPIRLVDGNSSVTEDAFRLSEPAVARTSVRDELEATYRAAARAHFTRRADHFAVVMDASYQQLQVRNQKTRWGSYSPRTGTLSMNWRLMMAPPEIVDYVLVHELAHVAHPNHSDRFWRRVATFDPDYARKAAWLKTHSPRLVFDPARWV